MEPIIRNFRNHYSPEGTSARLIWLDDNPTTCTMTYSEIAADATSAHHIHPWEHEVFIVAGEGQLLTDEGPRTFRAGSAVYVPPEQMHQFQNTGDATLKFICVIPNSGDQ